MVERRAADAADDHEEMQKMFEECGAKVTTATCGSDGQWHFPKRFAIGTGARLRGKLRSGANAVKKSIPGGTSTD